MEIVIDLLHMDDTIDELKEFKKTFDLNVTKYMTQLVDLGAEQAAQNFKTAQYDGANDVYVSSSVGKRRKKTVGEIEAFGKATLFIEFGTGITYGSDHPEAHKFGFRPGSYGPNGLKPTWGYYGEGGTNGAYQKTTARGDLYTTHGNPANRCMYEAGKTVEKLAPKIAREVFK